LSAAHDGDLRPGEEHRGDISAGPEAHTSDPRERHIKRLLGNYGAANEWTSLRVESGREGNDREKDYASSQQRDPLYGFVTTTDSHRRRISCANTTLPDSNVNLATSKQRQYHWENP
jgi:hypothetical protein